jgi:Undecaprenyl-phosphate glucose phosphotransferase
MQYKYATFFRLVNALVDYLVLNATLVVSLIVIWPEAVASSAVSDYRIHILLFNLLWFVTSTQTKLYDRVLNTEAIPTIKKTLITLFLFLAAPLAISLFVPSLSISFKYLFYFVLLFSVSVLAVKVLFLSVRKSQRRYWVDYKKVVILGSGSAANDLVDFFSDSVNSGYVVGGYFDDKPNAEMSKRVEYLGQISECVDYAKKGGVSEIFSALSSQKLELVKSLIKKADNNLIRFRLVPDISAFMDKNVFIDYYGALPILSTRHEPLEVKVNELVKQAFDYVFAATTIVFFLSWMVPIIALAIRLDSKGPIFFRQLRSGKDNKPFFCLKFRSMYVNDESDTKQATKNDKRITRVGAFLRKTSLDEFPQFFNVLMGDMSIVGPRPHMLKHTEDYAELVNDFMVRQYVTPGITGWAQVKGFRGETKETESMNKRVKADLWYMENWSLFLDLKIVFLTIYTAFKGDEKAY